MAAMRPACLGIVLLAALGLPTRAVAQRADSTAPPPPADLVLRGGLVRTLDPSRPTVSALAVREGRLVALGEPHDVAPLVGPATRVVELDGRLLLPGFTDAHLHLFGHGLALRRIDLVGTASFDEVIAAVAARAATLPAGAFILGRGWDQNDWATAEFPVHVTLSERVPAHPVVLERVDGHALLANAAALRLAGVGEDFVDPPGGRALRGIDGSLTGVFIDNAMEAVLRVVPAAGEGERRLALREAIADLHRHGITSVHDAGLSLDELATCLELARDGEFALRAHVLLGAGQLPTATDFGGLPAVDLDGRGLIAVRGVKAYVDGALGSRGAALLHDYADEPGHRGLLVTPPEELSALAERCLRGGWQLAVHAIGDRGNRLALDAFQAALAAVPVEERHPLSREPRFRIEHAQILDPVDIPRFAALGVIASMQAQHWTSDSPWASARVGADRMVGAYAWRALLDAGAVLAGGSDAPVERPDPLAAFIAAVRRPPAQGGPDGRLAPRALSREEALAHLTLGPAFAAFEEQRLGPLVVGRPADLVVLSADLLTVPDAALDALAVDLVVFAGAIVHARDTTSR